MIILHKNKNLDLSNKVFYESLDPLGNDSDGVNSVNKWEKGDLGFEFKAN